MKWFSTVSTLSRFDDAVLDVGEAARAVSWDHGDPDLAIFFACGHHDLPDDLGDRIQAWTGVRHVLGCSAGGVIGGGREIEGRPSLSLTLASLPSVEVVPLHLSDGDLPGEDAPPGDWYRALGVDDDPSPSFVLLADPFSTRADALCRGLDYAFPGSAKIGGLASGGRDVGSHRLWVGRDVHREGAVGIALRGDLLVDTVVAQGCRPTGRPLRVTKCQGTYLVELDGKRAFDVLRELFEEASERDRELVNQRALFLGLLHSPFVVEPGPGDFLIRPLVGFDEESGVVQVGAVCRPGQTIQFHLRDAEASARDLDAVLTSYVETHGIESPPAGALLFSCLGRGEHLYGVPDHDSLRVREILGDVPLGGFFCNGEIGPVGGTTFVHGYTSALAIFREP